MKPLFELMGKNITLVGGNGDGQTTKVANQIIVALNIEAVGEALLFASKAGADPARVRQALMGGFASSRILEVHGERMVKRNFDPGFRIELHQKDLNLALQGARSARRRLPNTATAQQLFNACVAAWRRGLGSFGMVRVLELLASHEIGQATPRMKGTRPGCCRLTTCEGRETTLWMSARCCGGCSMRRSPPPRRTLCVPANLPPPPARPHDRRRRRQGRGGDGARGRGALAAGPAARRSRRHPLRPRRRPLARIEVVEASHPVPDAAGPGRGARASSICVRGLGPDDLVLCLISGGGSALLSLARSGDIDLADKQAINRALLSSGAHIGEMNCVRKHLSAIKGGRLAVAAAPAPSRHR